MLAFETEVGSKRLGIFESLESEENRVQKCIFHAPSPHSPSPSPSLDGILAVAVMQHCREQ